MSVEGWRLGMRLVLRADGLELPSDWLGNAAVNLAAGRGAACGGSAPALTIFREQETRGLEDLARALGLGCLKRAQTRGSDGAFDHK